MFKFELIKHLMHLTCNFELIITPEKSGLSNTCGHKKFKIGKIYRDKQLFISSCEAYTESSSIMISINYIKFTLYDEFQRYLGKESRF